MQCEMCGAESKLSKTIVEGSNMDLCSNCSKFGKRVNTNLSNSGFKKPNFHNKKPFVKKEEVMEELVTNYKELIKDKRESLNLKQVDLAVKMAEKESIIHKVESGNFKPSFRLAKKFQRILRIKILEKTENKSEVKYKSGSQAMTIGDMMKFKKK